MLPATVIEPARESRVLEFSTGDTALYLTPSEVERKRLLKAGASPAFGEHVHIPRSWVRLRRPKKAQKGGGIIPDGFEPSADKERDLMASFAVDGSGWVETTDPVWARRLAKAGWRLEQSGWYLRAECPAGNQMLRVIPPSPNRKAPVRPVHGRSGEQEGVSDAEGVSDKEEREKALF